MTPATLIKQVLTIKKVITKAQSKFGKASIIVPLNGKDEFLGLNEKVDENAFGIGKTYELEISISKTGKRYVNAIVREVEGEKVEVKTNSVSKTTEPETKSGLDRETRITLMNVGNVAATLSAGDLDGFEKAFRVVKKVYQSEGVL